MEEQHGPLRYVVIFAGIALCGVICSFTLGFLDAPDGSRGPSLFGCRSPILAVGSVVVCVLIASVVAGIAGRLTNAVVGLFILGAGTIVPAARTGTIVDLALSGDGSLAAVAAEVALMGALALGAAFIVFRIAGMPEDIAPRQDDQDYDRVLSRPGLTAAITGVAVIPLVWLLARSADKGQVVLAVLIGSMAVGLIGRLASPHMRPIMLFALPCAFGAIGHLIGLATMHQPVMEAYLHRSLPAVNYPMPLEYLTGTLMGVSLGIGWARSFLHNEEEEVAPAAPERKAAADAG